MLGCCGIDCLKCEAYLATKADDNAMRKEVADKWTQEYNSNFSPEDINCLGCTAEGVHFYYTDHLCTLRKCCLEKNLSNCAGCNTYPCENLQGFFENVPEAKTNLESVN